MSLKVTVSVSSPSSVTSCDVNASPSSSEPSPSTSTRNSTDWVASVSPSLVTSAETVMRSPCVAVSGASRFDTWKFAGSGSGVGSSDSTVIDAPVASVTVYDSPASVPSALTVSPISLVPAPSPSTVTVAMLTLPLSSVSASAAVTSAEEPSSAIETSVVWSSGLPPTATSDIEATFESPMLTVKSYAPTPPSAESTTTSYVVVSPAVTVASAGSRLTDVSSGFSCCAPTAS